MVRRGLARKDCARGAGPMQEAISSPCSMPGAGLRGYSSISPGLTVEWASYCPVPMFRIFAVIVALFFL